jgi:subtilase family serine protease
MIGKPRFSPLSVTTLCLAVAFPIATYAQGSRSRIQITQPINESVLHRLSGNTRSQANIQNDAGAVADDLAMDHMLLQLQRPAEQEQALRQFIESQQDPQSANYRQFKSADELGATYGPAQEDIDTVTTWLESHGFTVNSVYPNRLTIDFSGTAQQVQTAFHTAIHRLNVNGVEHIANMSDPMIPMALSPAIAGVVAMHDFMPHAYNKVHKQYTYTSGSSTYQALVPGDLATIYNLNPLFTAGTSGKGQIIAVVEDSDFYNTADWTAFRNAMGLSTYTSGSLVSVHPAPASGTNNCSAPGANSDDIETELDAEWASAAAPNATIWVATCADTRTTFGGLTAILNMANAKTARPTIISLSYGECEAENGAAANLAYSNAFQTAVAAGISVFVAAGDEGAASCDAGATGASHGIGVSGFASTAYNVAVGGTDFADSYLGTNSNYWSTTNSSTYESAKSYVPEIPWNNSCAGSLLAKVMNYTTVYGTAGFCGSSTASADGLLDVVGGSGGPSGCAIGSPSTTGVVSGSCAGIAKPSWQAGIFGNPSDKVRDIPDVSLFAGNGLWGHYYVFCFSDVRNGGASCKGAPSTWAGAGGTSFASPIMAGIQALVNQVNGNQPTPATHYYALAKAEFGASGSSACNSEAAGGPSSNCIFYNVTLGDNAVNCSGTVNCFGATASTSGHGGGRFGGGGGGSSANGALTTSSSSFNEAFGTGVGWNFATGIGSVNAYNLVKGWQ